MQTLRCKLGLRQQMLEHIFETKLVGARPGLEIWFLEVCHLKYGISNMNMACRFQAFSR
jgi:hypothetical protein